jgi:hypothetical protein
MLAKFFERARGHEWRTRWQRIARGKACQLCKDQQREKRQRELFF